MRILIVTHAPLKPEFGAGQAALNLAAALRERGHQAIAWSTEPLPREARSWDRWRWQRRRLERFLEQGPSFDVIDLPPVSASPKVAAHAPLVARSVQPDLRYFWAAWRAALGRLPRSAPRLGATVLADLAVSAAIIRGWRRARWILCLGSHEHRWMGRRFPSTLPRLLTYRNALDPEVQPRLAEIRAGRARPHGLGVRFLWIGRWVPQKGTRRLVRFIEHRARKAPRDQFTIAGCSEAARRDLSRDLVSSERVDIVHSFRRDDLPDLLETHDVGLFTSSVEGWGLSLNEMLESGMPVFATDAGGVEDLRPFFPNSLRPFPPPHRLDWATVEDSARSNGYYAHFTWASIAATYEAEVLARLGS